VSTHVLLYDYIYILYININNFNELYKNKVKITRYLKKVPVVVEAKIADSWAGK